VKRQPGPIKVIPISDLKPFAGNPREHSADVEGLVRSLHAYGWTNPILVQKGTNRVIAGHGRMMAAAKAGWSEVPVIELALDDKQADAYTIADNRLAEKSKWDMPKLKDLLINLDDGGFDISLTGFDANDLEKMMAADGLGAGGDEVPSAPVTPITKPGDLWILGEHRLLCGDSTKAGDVARVIDGEKASIMWTDPPYGVSYVGKTKEAKTIKNDGAEGLPALLGGAFGAADSIALTDGAAIYIAHPPGALSVTFDNAFVAQGWRLHQTLIWVKDSMVLGHSDYHFKHEPITFGYKPGSGRFGRGGIGWYGPDNAVSVFEVPRPKASEEHPTMKPVELVMKMIFNSSAPGHIVYEPFCGSGSTLIACEKLGRKCRALELDPIYCDVIVARWEKLTNAKATKS
jgi:DNA modification methylase